MSTQPDVLEDLDAKYQRYLGIPRHLIPWFPRINAETCVGCKACMEFCADGVYAYDEQTRQVYVANPWHCQIYCQSCTHVCPRDAITFIDRREVKARIRELREKYPPA